MKDGFRLHVMDQTAMVLDYKNTRGPWSKKGERIYERYNGNHERIMVCGAISSHGDQLFSITRKFHTEEAVEFLELLMRRRKIGLIMDKSSVHKSNAVLDLIDDNPHRIRVRVFPTGWPQLNAIEHCWSVLKSRPFMHAKYESADARIDAVEEFLNNHTFRMDVERSLFKKPIAKTF